jgi:hypothetical protein
MDDLENDPFPFYCQICGLVCANTAASPIICPHCKTTAIVQYGTAQASPAAREKYPVMRNGNREVFARHNLCPGCNSMTLTFAGPLWSAD